VEEGGRGLSRARGCLHDTISSASERGWQGEASKRKRSPPARSLRDLYSKAPDWELKLPTLAGLLAGALAGGLPRLAGTVHLLLAHPPLRVEREPYLIRRALRGCFAS